MVDSLTKVKYTNKERYCQSKKCKNMLEFESFSCECESGKKWDHVNKKCIPQITECLENQIFTISEFGKGSCRCIKGFVMNLTTNNCESFDVCNENHRMMLSITPIKPCNDLHAKCISSNDSSFFEYECVCKTGYYSEFGATSALATVCKANECKNCAHFCKNVNHTFECSCSIGYSLTSSGGCVPNKGFNVSECFFNSLLNQPAPFINNNGKCQCIENFIFKKQTKTCQPDLKLIKIFNCATKKIEIKNDHFLGCKCAFGQAFNYKNRNCLQKCDIQAVNDCATNHHAECQFVDNKTKCLCKKNQIAFSTSNNSTYFKCIDKCTTFLQMPENEKFQCSSKFSVCDSTLFEFDQYSTNSKMFIANFSQIMSKNHCQCEIGFEKDISTNQCKLSNQPLKIIKNIEFIGNLKTLKNIRTAFEQFMKSFFLTLKFYSFDCHIFKQNDKVICSATFQSYKDEVSIKNLFNLACIGITNLKSKQQCVYLTKNFELVQKILIDKNTQDTKLLSAVLIRPNNKTKFVIENFNYCKNKNRCDVFTNSICQSITLQTQNTFKCLCNLKYFNVLNSQMIGSIELQYCAPKNFCDSKNPYCLDQTAQCHSIVEKNINNSFSSLIFCVCPSNITLPSQMHNCSSACISNFCKNGGICVQDIYNLENISCKCLEGFNGPFCDLKIEKTNNSKIFLYTTILISFIAFFAVIGMCFLYFKKTKL